MSSEYLIEATAETATGILCETCETFYMGEAGKQHVAETDHVVSYVRSEIA